MVSSYHSERAGATRFDLCLAPFLQTPGLPFADVLSEEQIQEAFAAEGISLGESEGTVYTPAVTLWAFLSQMIHTDQLRSCPAAVARVVVLLTALGRKPCSADTAAYCRARGFMDSRDPAAHQQDVPPATGPRCRRAPAR